MAIRLTEEQTRRFIRQIPFYAADLKERAPLVESLLHKHGSSEILGSKGERLWDGDSFGRYDLSWEQAIDDPRVAAYNERNFKRQQRKERRSRELEKVEESLQYTPTTSFEKRWMKAGQALQHGGKLTSKALGRGYHEYAKPAARVVGGKAAEMMSEVPKDAWMYIGVGTLAVIALAYSAKTIGNEIG